VAPFATGRCEYLAGRGHEVTVCTAFPFYPQWRVADEYRGLLFGRQERNGVAILRCPLYVPRRVTALKRTLHEASFLAASLIRLSLRRRPEVMFVTSPPLSLSIAGVMLSRLWSVPCVFHVEDLQPDTALDLGMLPPSGALARSLYALERTAYRNAALVSTLTEAMRKKIVSKGIEPNKVVLSSGWAEPALFSIPVGAGGKDFRRSFGFDDRFLVVHAGNMGVKQGLGVILEAAQRTAANSQIAYLLVGDGAMREALEARARSMPLRNLRFLPLQPIELFRDMLAAADVGLLTQQRTVADIVFPSKVLTLLAAARPVIASISPGSEVARVLNESGAAVIVPAEDPRALADAVLAVARDREGRRLMAERGRTYALGHWNRDRTLPLMEARLQQLITCASAGKEGIATIQQPRNR
jgi:colanic acid biosynthesis glycosyl transferase WcaI